MNGTLAAPVLALAALVASAGIAPAAADYRQERKVRGAKLLVDELLTGDDRVVPAALLSDVRCIALFPGVVEAAFGLGGRHGGGVASCRGDGGAWSAPAFFRISGGSVGLQVGFRKVDLVMFFVTEEGARSLSGGSFSLGGEVSIAAGPIDRKAGVSGDPRYEGDIFLYARARGLFAGAAIEGTRLAGNLEATRKYYRERYFPEELLFQGKRPELPPEAAPLLDALAGLPD